MTHVWRVGKALLFLGCLAVLWWAIRLGVERIEWVPAGLPAGRAPVFSTEALRTPGEGVFLGIYDPYVPRDMRFLEATEERLRLRFPLVSIYQAWGSKPGQQFDARTLNIILARGAISVLTWEPWVTDFVHSGLPPMPDRQFRNLQAIARGEYDFYIVRWARAAKRWGRPLMIRLGHEMNAKWYPWGELAFGNTAEDYVAMWRHVVDIFRREGVSNVIWNWSVAMRPISNIYPGDDYVDWVGITILNFGTVPPGWKWRSFSDIFASYYEDLRRLGKPIMIAEVASAEEGGSKARWIAEGLGSLRTEFPLVKSFMWFNVAQDKYWPINWSLTSSPEAARAFRQAATDPYFISFPR